MMWKRYVLQFQNRTLLLIVQLIILMACIGYLGYFYIANILPDKQVKTIFRQSTCFLISKKLSIKGHVIHRYRADFLINYNVNGVQYSRWVSGNGLDTSYLQNQSDQEDILSNFDVGGTYPCYYNPENPQMAILVARHNWFSTFPLVVPSLISLVILYYLLKNIYWLLSRIRTKLKPVVQNNEKGNRKGNRYGRKNGKISKSNKA